MNASWHRQNQLLRGASTAQCIAWHLEHWEKCGCRPIPRSVLRSLDLRVQAAERSKSATSRQAGTFPAL